MYSTNERCGFQSRHHEPRWRAPEEMDLSHKTIVNEKVDIYALGNILFYILTLNLPHGKMQSDRMNEVRVAVKAGVRPGLSKLYTKSKDPVVVAFKEAMDMCFQPNPALRATARQVADRLFETLAEIKSEGNATSTHEE
jgi:serine/threonine protein kinase